MLFNGEKITQESIIVTRQYFADFLQRHINGVKDGTCLPASHVDLTKYVADLERRKADMLAGNGDNTFTFIQRAYWIQTGKFTVLLPRKDVSK
jgi:hypothetical protein